MLMYTPKPCTPHDTYICIHIGAPYRQFHHKSKTRTRILPMLYAIQGDSTGMFTLDFTFLIR